MASESPMVENIKAAYSKAQPYIQKAADAINFMEPYVEKAVIAGQQAWEKLQPYHPEELLPALIGLILVFYGGTFMTVIAAVEAYRLIGWRDTAEALKILYKNYKAAAAANKKDNEEDKDGDGIPDVKQIDKAMLATRKLQLLMKATDPVQLDKAVTAITQGFMAVVVSLRVKFAKAITLGITISEILEDHIEDYLLPIVEKVTPTEYHKWLPLGQKYVSRGIGITIAWWLQRVVSAAHSAIRGAELLVVAILKYAIRYDYVEKGTSKNTRLFQLIALGIALVGFWMQLRGGFGISFPFNVFLLPVTLAEYFLQYFVGSGQA